MEVIIQSDPQVASALAARYVARRVREKPKFVLGLATGSTPLGLYGELVRLNREREISFRGVTTFNLDEYIGLPEDHVCSYRRFMQENLFDHIDIARDAGLPYVYLGYWVPGSAKMGYKAKFSAVEVYRGGEWQELGDPSQYSSETHPLSTDPIAEQVARINLPDTRPTSG